MANNWKKKLDDAEVTPNPRVWDRIAADLNAGASSPRSSFPSYLAWAAVVAVFALSGMFIWYSSAPTQPSEMAQVEMTNPAPSSSDNFQSNQDISSTEQTGNSTEQVAAVTSATITKKNTPKKRNIAAVTALPRESEQSLETGAVTNVVPNESERVSSASQTGMAVATTDEIGSMPEGENKPIVPETKVAPAVAKFEYPEAEDFLIEKKKKSKSSDKRLWVGVAQGVGSYSSQLNATSGGGDSGIISPFTTDRTAEDLQTKQQSMNEQMTLSTGVYVGVPLANKLAVVTGLTYNKSNFSSDANTLNGELLHFTADVIEVTDLGKIEEVNLNGTYEMAVMPVLADYRLVSGALNWSLQAGPELGFLLRQQISNDQLNINRTTRPGDLYRPFHLRVAVGTTVSYAMSSNFEVSFQPIVEQAVTSITNASASFDSYPLNYSALVGFRYTFN